MDALPSIDKKRIFVGLSGGVDSAVAALLLKRAGHEVHALFMSNWDADDEYCTAAQDYQDARAVAERLAIPLHTVRFADEYRSRVFEDFLQEHRAGRTPNPDVLCNREIKFGVALKYIQRLGGDYFATGHYARVMDGEHGIRLFKACDLNKDQSYFLHAVAREDLAKAIFPLGALTKAEVRDEARRAALPVFDKADSTGICFIGERPFRQFLNRYIAHQKGPIETPEGIELGTHCGLAFYTLGQRQGLLLGGLKDTAPGAWYVARKDSSRNVLIVVQDKNHSLLMSQELTTHKVHWINKPTTDILDCHVKTRYRQADQAARIVLDDNGCSHVQFQCPQRAVTPGQYAVFYQNDECLGGAAIETVASLTTEPYNPQRLANMEAL
jgi:tRNA-uridine 2-sulfurtransferase